MYLVKKTYDNSPEFLRNEHYENITCTLADTGEMCIRDSCIRNALL